MKKNRNILLILLLIILIIILMTSYFKKDDEKVDNSKVISYQGNNLRVGIDGSSSSTLPTSGNYYLTSYECDNSNTKVSWDRTNYKLTVSNGKDGGGVACNLEFESKPLLSEMPVGSYVDYTGSGGKVGSTSVACQTNGSASSSTATAETEAPNSCSGQNAREDLDSSGYTYGYCYNSNYKYYTTGWRIAYIDSNNKPIIVSAGSPECNSRTSSTANVIYIKTANAKALKYCNADYVDGNCTCTDSDSDGLCDSASTDAWAINDTDFYNITKAISGYGKRLTSGSSSLGDSGGTLGTTLYCDGKYSYRECGYNNSLIDNGGYYWFAAQYSSSGTACMSWNPKKRGLGGSAPEYVYGLRPVISLSSTVRVTGGAGTIDDPYTVVAYNSNINDGDSCTTCEDFSVDYPFDGSKTIDEMNAEGLITIAGTSSNSAYDWVIDSTNKYFKSGNYNVNSSTGSSTITFTPTVDASLSFDYGVGSETNYDKLTITLNDGSTDNVLVNAISGSKTGSITNQALTGGTTYVLTLKYVKDGSGYTSPDIGYIKNFVIE